MIAVLTAMVLPTLVTWLYFVALRDAAAGVQQGVYALGKAIQFGFPVFWVVAVQRARLRLRVPGRAGLVDGILFGAIIFAAMLLMYYGWLKPRAQLGSATEAICRKVASFGIDSPGEYVALALFYSLAHSFLEEYYYRWFVFGQFRRFVPLWAAILVSSLAFTAHHVILLGTYFGYVSWQTALFSTAIAVGGAVWAWIYARSGSLLGPWISHLFADAAIFAIGYGIVADCL
jgi:membrane protease YdiL (CAAX protease family)